MVRICTHTLAHLVDIMLGVVLETFLGGIVEIVLFMVLLHKVGANIVVHQNDANYVFIKVIQAAILGSILANLLLCLGACFFVGGLNRDEQTFDEAISEVGSGLLLVAGFGLLIPSAFSTSLQSYVSDASLTADQLASKTLHISRVTSVVLLVAFLLLISQDALCIFWLLTLP